jgi:hypothetical protein
MSYIQQESASSDAFSDEDDELLSERLFGAEFEVVGAVDCIFL